MSKPSKPTFFERYQNQAKAHTTETWAVSYSDLLTNLLVFFVMMMSASSMSSMKFEKVKNALRGEPGTDAVAVATETLKRDIETHNLQSMVDIVTNNDNVEINFHDRLLFESGRSEVRPEGVATIETFAKTLVSLPSTARLAVEGYTDDNPVDPRVYPSNWHLSAARSLAVLQILEKLKVCRENCEIRGFGEYRPAVPNRDAEGRPIVANQSENRRVVLRIY